MKHLNHLLTPWGVDCELNLSGILFWNWTRSEFTVFWKTNFKELNHFSPHKTGLLVIFDTPFPNILHPQYFFFIYVVFSLNGKWVLDFEVTAFGIPPRNWTTRLRPKLFLNSILELNLFLVCVFWISFHQGIEPQFCSQNSGFSQIGHAFT